jgi:cobalt-zinc-cadmium efflux system protein
MTNGKADLNTRSAFLHLASDALLALAVAVAGGVIMFTGWLWLDPAASIVLAITILAGTWSLMSQSMNLMLDAVPEGIDPVEVRAFLAALPGVVEVHDLHIWAMSTTDVALTAHLVRPGAGLDDELLGKVCRDMQETFGIGHVTVQVEQGDPDHACQLAPAEVV